MTIHVGIVMDPISEIHYRKDSSLAMLLAAQQRQWQLSYMEPQDLYLQSGEAMGSMRPLQVFADPAHWYELGEARQQRSEEHTSELQSRENLVCRLLLDKK